MIPTFSRSWLRKITAQFDLEIAAVSLRSAWDMRRAWRPMCESPISPSISAFGTSAATESMTITSTAFERTSTSTISSACSPVSGWLAALRKVLPELHDRALAIAFRDLGHGRIEGSAFLLEGLIAFPVLVFVFVSFHLQ